MPATLATFILTSSMVSLPATVSEKGDPFPLTNSCILVLLQKPSEPKMKSALVALKETRGLPTSRRAEQEDNHTTATGFHSPRDAAAAAGFRAAGAFRRARGGGGMRQRCQAAASRWRRWHESGCCLLLLLLVCCACRPTPCSHRRLLFLNRFSVLFWFQNPPIFVLVTPQHQKNVAWCSLLL